MLFKKNKESIFFIHVPRTGGRYVTNLFIRNDFSLIPFYQDGYNFYKGIDDRHLHHEYLKDFNIYNKSKKLVIVRDPLKRFISAASVDININKEKHKFKLNNIENVIDYIKFQQDRYSFYINWFRPQHEFVSKDCFIWKHEDGLETNFINFIYKNFNISLIADEKITPWKVDYDYCPTIKETKAIKEAVKIFYKKDYEKFYI